MYVFVCRGEMNEEMRKQYIAYFCVHIIRDVWDSLQSFVGVAKQIQAEAICVKTVPKDQQ